MSGLLVAKTATGGVLNEALNPDSFVCPNCHICDYTSRFLCPRIIRVRLPSVHAGIFRGTLCGLELHKALSKIRVSLCSSQLYTMQTNRHTEDCAIQTGIDWITAYIIRLPGKSTAEGIRQRQPVSSQ